MPKLWTDTLEDHRREVGEAILDTTAQLVAMHGLANVSMSQIAEQTGIGRATLYKYFPDLDAILLAWHERHVAAHLAQLAEVRARAGRPVERLEAVLLAFASHAHLRDGGELVAMLHRGEHVAKAHQKLLDLIRDLVADGARAGELRADVAPRELAVFCVHALSAASGLPSKAAVERLVAVTLSALRSPGA